MASKVRERGGVAGFPADPRSRGALESSAAEERALSSIETSATNINKYMYLP
jgi:hypothetical protein